MNSVSETNEPHNDVERLLQEIARSGDARLRVDSGDGLFIAWLSGQTAPQCGCHADAWWTAGTEGWHLMAQFGAVHQLRFVREPDGHHPGQEALSIRFIGPNGMSSLRADYAPLYDDRGEPIDDRFARWEAVRARYGGQNELRVENGMILPLG